MIHEGEYLGGPVQNVVELNSIVFPISGEFHFVIDDNAYGVWNGVEWVMLETNSGKIIREGEAIDISVDGDHTVTEAVLGEATIGVKYDDAKGIGLETGKLASKIDNDSIVFDTSGNMVATFDKINSPIYVKTNITNHPTKYKYVIDGETIEVELAYSNHSNTITITDATGGLYSAPTKTYNFDETNNEGTIT